MLCISTVYGEDAEMNDAAHIVASKFTLSQYAVEGMDYVIDYRLYNVGDKVGDFGYYNNFIHRITSLIINECFHYFLLKHSLFCKHVLC